MTNPITLLNEAQRLRDKYNFIIKYKINHINHKEAVETSSIIASELRELAERGSIINDRIHRIVIYNVKDLKERGVEISLTPEVLKSVELDDLASGFSFIDQCFERGILKDQDVNSERVIYSENTVTVSEDQQRSFATEDSKKPYKKPLSVLAAASHVTFEITNAEGKSQETRFDNLSGEHFYEAAGNWSLFTVAIFKRIAQLSPVVFRRMISQIVDSEAPVPTEEQLDLDANRSMSSQGIPKGVDLLAHTYDNRFTLKGQLLHQLGQISLLYKREVLRALLKGVPFTQLCQTVGDLLPESAPVLYAAAAVLQSLPVITLPLGLFYQRNIENGWIGLPDHVKEKIFNSCLGIDQSNSSPALLVETRPDFDETPTDVATIQSKAGVGGQGKLIAMDIENHQSLIRSRQFRLDIINNRSWNFR